MRIIEKSEIEVTSVPPGITRSGFHDILDALEFCLTNHEDVGKWVIIQKVHVTVKKMT